MLKEKDIRSNAFLEASRLFIDYDIQIVSYLEEIAYRYLGNDMRGVYTQKKQLKDYLKRKVWYNNL